MDDKVLEFLEHSNFIEGVFGNIDKQVEAWKYALEEERLTSRLIREVHQILISDQSLDKTDSGGYRMEDVYIGEFKKENFRPHWATIPSSIEQLVDQINFTISAKDDLGLADKEALSKEAHIRFELIHPFVDGNGRSGRIIFNWHRVKLGLDVLVIREEDKQEYYQWFKEAS